MNDNHMQGKPPLATSTATSDQLGASETLSKTRQGSQQSADGAGLEDMELRMGSEAPEGQDRPEGVGAVNSPVIQIGSTTLTRLSASKRPVPSTVCEACPAAVWYVRTEKVQCYCRLMHLISWETGQADPITICDGPAIASQ